MTVSRPILLPPISAHSKHTRKFKDDDVLCWQLLSVSGKIPVLLLIFLALTRPLIHTLWRSKLSIVSCASSPLRPEKARMQDSRDKVSCRSDSILKAQWDLWSIFWREALSRFNHDNIASFLPSLAIAVTSCELRLRYRTLFMAPTSVCLSWKGEIGPA